MTAIPICLAIVVLCIIILDWIDDDDSMDGDMRGGGFEDCF